MDNWLDLMNLDLNLGPGGPTAPDVGPEMEPSLGDVDRWESPLELGIREALRLRTMQRLRLRHLQLPLEARSLQLGADLFGNSGGTGGECEDGNGIGTSQVGEGSVAPEERSCEVLKTCENNVTSLEEKEDVEKCSTQTGSFFDCNICLDSSREPVVTCCGHLFCWSCIYRWLHIHSDAKECPVCKGEVTLKNVTPIHGRGTHTHNPEEEADIKIPARPSARRVESLRQTIPRTASLVPMEEVIRRLNARFEQTRDSFQRDVRSLTSRLMSMQAPVIEQASLGPSGDAMASLGPSGDAIRDRILALQSEQNSTILNRILALQREQTSIIRDRILALQREQTSTATPENVVNLTQDMPGVEVVPRRLLPLTYRRAQPNWSGSSLTPTERYDEAFISRSLPVRSQELQPSLVDDRDSFSSIAASIHGESQTGDTAVEIDSLVSLSTSSSRRRHDASRSADMDSGDSRALRRRRLN